MGQEASKPDLNVRLLVIGCGMSRTGTATFSEALKILLGGPVYHGGSQLVGAGEKHMRDWIELCKHTPIKDEADRKVVLDGLKSILGGYTACTDLPPILFTEELVELFPDAQVICTVRDPESWWKSVSKITSKTDTEKRDERNLRFILALLPTMRYWYNFNQALRYGRFGELYYQSGHKHPHPGQYQVSDCSSSLHLSRFLTVPGTHGLYHESGSSRPAEVLRCEGWMGTTLQDSEL
jgi:hypothetical protein